MTAPRALLLAAALLCMSTLSRADTIHFSTGGEMQGVVLNVEATPRLPRVLFNSVRGGIVKENAPPVSGLPA